MSQSQESMDAKVVNNIYCTFTQKLKEAFSTDVNLSNNRQFHSIHAGLSLGAKQHQQRQ